MKNLTPMTSSDAARLLNRLGIHLTPSTVKWHADAGNIPVQRTAGGIRLFRREDIKAFANARLTRQKKGIAR